MDLTSFDRLSRTFIEAVPRRRLTGLLGGLSLAAVLPLLTNDASAAKRTKATSKKKGKKAKSGPRGPAGATGERGPQGPAGTLAGFVTTVTAGAPEELGTDPGSSSTGTASCPDPNAIVTGISYFFTGDTTTVNVVSIGLGPTPGSAFVFAERTATGGASSITAVITCIAPS